MSLIPIGETRMRSTTKLLQTSCLALVLLLGGCATQPTASPDHKATDSASHVRTPAAHAPLLLVSIDGFRTDYLDRNQSPTLSTMAANGVRAKWMQPAFPSLTFPNHYTLVTGKYPDHTGIINNSMHDKTLGRFSLSRREAVQDGRWWDQAEPIWVSADKQGLRTATMFWPGSEAEIRGYRPDYWFQYSGVVSGDQRVDQILAWLDLPAAQRPDFLTLYFDRVDHAGHEYGPDTPQVDAAIRQVDGAMAQLVTGLKARRIYDKLNIIVISDHGMASVPKGHEILLDKLIDLDHMHIVAMGILAGFNPKPGYEKSVADKLLKKHPHMRCWRKGHFPARLNYGTNARTPAISCLADVGWRISSSDYIKNRKRPMTLGEHGYDIDGPLMHALFIAHGPGFRAGVVVDGFPNVDVYPLMTHLLGIKAQANDGNMTPWKNALRPSTMTPPPTRTSSP